MSPDDYTHIIERAKAEAERRWGASRIETLAPVDRTPKQWLDLGTSAGFALGALWQAERDAAREQVRQRDEVIERVRALAEEWSGAREDGYDAREIHENETWRAASA